MHSIPFVIMNGKMKSKIFYLFLLLAGCAPKLEKHIRNLSRDKSISPCKKEVYRKFDDSAWTPLPVFEKQFKMTEVANNCIRLYYLPSFMKEMVVDVCPLKSFVRMPDTGTVWESMQIVNRDAKGTITSGRVAKISDSIPKINIRTELVVDSISKKVYHQLDSIDTWNLMSIEYEDCLMMDGIGIEVQSKKGSSTNHFGFSQDEYKDTRYNLISSILKSLYDSQ